jgi:hypothetical protein
MATTTATITLTSSDLTADALSLSKTMTMTKAGGAEGLDRVKYIKEINASTAGTNVEVLASDNSQTKASKVYIANLSTTDSEYFNVHIGTSSTQEIGRLYAGDWMLVPWTQSDANADILLAPSVATAMAYEVILFREV